MARTAAAAHRAGRPGPAPSRSRSYHLASGNGGSQDWVLGAVFDYRHCDDGDGESSLEEVVLEPDVS